MAGVAGVMLGLAACALGQIKPAPARLAIIAEDGDAATAADLLTVELSRKDSVQLLERGEIEKVYREQGLSAANKDYLKLGQVLGADGLLLLKPVEENGGPSMSVRLVAARPGVVIGVIHSAWPIEDAGQWAKWVGNQFEPLLPKLSVQMKDAVPISVVNFHSALRSAGTQDLERQLTLLAIERLTRERTLFVLERRRLELLGGEKELSGTNEGEFWSGSYLLDGVLDRDGYSKETVTVSARLIPPKGGAPFAIEVSGSRTNLSDVVSQLAGKVIQNLKLSTNPAPWNAADEAEKFFEEGKWAYHWGMLPEAAVACENSWGLGKQTKDLAELRIRSYAEDGVDATVVHYDLVKKLISFVPSTPHQRGQFIRPPDPVYGASVPPDSAGFARVRRAMELYCEGFRTFVSADPSPGWEWNDLGLDILEKASCWLRHYYYMPEARAGQEETIAGVRTLAREMAGAIGRYPAFTNRFDMPKAVRNKPNWGPHSPVGYELQPTSRNLITTKAMCGVYWNATPEESLGIYREIIDGGFMPKLRRHFLEMDFAERPPWNGVVGGTLEMSAFRMEEPLGYLTGWKWEDRRRAVSVWHAFIEQLSNSTNESTRVEGLFLKCAQTRTDAEHDRAFRELVAFLGQEQDGALAVCLDDNLLGDIDSLMELRGREGFEQSAADARKKVWDQFKQTLAEHRAEAFRRAQLPPMTNYLAGGDYDSQTFNGLFFSYDYHPEEARLLLPALAAYRSNVIYQAAAVNRELEETRQNFPKDPKRYGSELAALFHKQGRFMGANFDLDRLERLLKAKLTPPEQAAFGAVTNPEAALFGGQSHAAHALTGSNAGIIPRQLPVPDTRLLTNVLEATRFWPVPDILQGSNALIRPAIANYCFREGRLWVETRFDRIGTYAGQESFFNRGAVFRVDLDSFRSETIPFDPAVFTLPAQNGGGLIDRMWEVYHGALYVSSADSLKRYSLKEKKWEDLPAPIHGHARFGLVGDRLLACTDDSILELGSDGKEARILASSRRRPPLTTLDSEENYGCAPILEGPAGALRVVVGGKLFEQPVGASDWTVVGSYPELSQGMFSLSGGALLIVPLLMNNPDQVFALFPGARAPELLLGRSRMLSPFGASSSGPPGRGPFPGSFAGRPTNPARPPWDRAPESSARAKWTMPNDVPPRNFSMCLEDRSLWLFVCRFGNRSLSATPPPQPEQTSWQGRLFHFQPEEPKPFEIPLELRCPEGAKPRGRLFAIPQGFLEATPRGLVVSTSVCPGVWIISSDQLTQCCKEWQDGVKAETQPHHPAGINAPNSAPPVQN